MSRYTTARVRFDISFPRSRGDEPTRSVQTGWYEQFSPLTRG